MSTNGQEKIYSIVTDRIIAELEKGTVPWRRPWDESISLPTNLKSMKAYRGSNILMLMTAGFSSKYWLTYKQAHELGGKIKTGEKGTPVTFWSFISKDESENSLKHAFLKYYTVFNLAQCEGLKAPEELTKTDIVPLAAAEEIVKNYPSPPTILSGSNASYHQETDIVTVPHLSDYIVESAIEEYYSTLFHELVHSTGHTSRLNRDLTARRGSDCYSFEELIAELGSAFLCAMAGISNEVIENQASYIANWLAALKNDNKLLIRAGSKAQAAVDRITNY